MTAIIIKGRSGGGGITPPSSLLSSLSFGFEYRKIYDFRNDINGNLNPTGDKVNNVFYSPEGILDNQSLSGINSAGGGTIIFPHQSPFTTFGNKNFTVAALVRLKPNTQPVNSLFCFVAKDEFLSARREFLLFFGIFSSSTGSFACLIGNGGSTQEIVDYPVDLSTFNFDLYHLIIAEYIQAQSILNLYLDNDLVGTRDISFTPNVYSGIMCIGNRFTGTQYDSIYRVPIFFNIQYVYKWDSLLSANDRNFLWNNGNFRFLSTP